VCGGVQGRGHSLIGSLSAEKKERGVCSPSLGFQEKGKEMRGAGLAGLMLCGGHGRAGAEVVICLAKEREERQESMHGTTALAQHE
jgi:hypothetical protein